MKTGGSVAITPSRPRLILYLKSSTFMHWDIVEVKPEPDYKLFVRFKDGLAGHVQLLPGELTGILAPLLNAEFFERVFIDSGAVAWPGDIDLAPDAMYEQIAGSRQKQLPRFCELKDLLCDPAHPDAFFKDFENHLKIPNSLETYAAWEKELQELDSLAWDFLKTKAKNYLLKRGGRGWQQLFDALGEALGYTYLKKDEGCPDVRFIAENSSKTPDLIGVCGTGSILCDVKTINISDKEIDARLVPQVVRKGDSKLDEGFFRKLDSDINAAKSQLESYDPNRKARHLIYFNICFDDWAGMYRDDYLRQIEQHLANLSPELEVVVRTGFSRSQTRLNVAH